LTAKMSVVPGPRAVNGTSHQSGLHIYHKAVDIVGHFCRAQALVLSVYVEACEIHDVLDAVEAESRCKGHQYHRLINQDVV